MKKSGFREGNIVLFVSGSTAGITTIEYELGLVKDLRDMFERIVPSSFDYKHHGKWNDNNGHSHIRASLLKSDLVVPFRDGKLVLGRWQQIVLVDFDTSPRNREIIVQISGE